MKTHLFAALASAIALSTHGGFISTDLKQSNAVAWLDVYFNGVPSDASLITVVWDTGQIVSTVHLDSPAFATYGYIFDNDKLSAGTHTLTGTYLLNGVSFAMEPGSYTIAPYDPTKRSFRVDSRMPIGMPDGGSAAAMIAASVFGLGFLRRHLTS